MGMLFNTQNTAKIVGLINNYFGLGKLGALNPNDFLNWPIPAAQGGTYGYARGKGLHFSTDPGADANWKHWLDRFDLHKNSKKGNSEYTATTVGNAIADAINNNLTQIEFFAVPDDVPGSNHISAEAGNVTDPANNVCKWITVFTLTHDKVANSTQRVQRKPQGKKPYRNP
jgi:hypothetical protein